MIYLICFLVLFSFVKCNNNNFTDFVELDEVITVSYNNNNFQEQSFIVSVITHSPKENATVEIMIFIACIIILMLISVLLCSLCCKHYRSRENAFFGRRRSTSSIQELIRERLQDRPPTYNESQNILNTTRNEAPPAYNEVVENTETQTERQSRPVFSISSKISENCAVLNLTETSAINDDDSDAPPSYSTSEGVLNPVLFLSVGNTVNQNNHVPSVCQCGQENVLHI